MLNSSTFCPGNQTMHIGSLEFSTPLILAPMAGVTDRPFRMLCRRLGADLAVSEMVGTRPELRSSLKTRLRLDHSGEAPPSWVQIVGADPAMLADAARLNEAEGAQIIDINMGCPAKKVCQQAAGSALLRDEKLVGRILDAVIAAVTVPVTLKIRTGWDPENKNAVRIARMAEKAGIQALSIHGRTRACGFKGEAEHESLRQVKEAVTMPVIANGDIDSPEKAADILEKSQADGLMIGRAAQGNPWIFRQIAHYLAHGQKPAAPSFAEVKVTLLEHLDALYAFYGEERGYRVARKHIDWYLKAQLPPDMAAIWRRRILAIDGATDQRRMLISLLDATANHEELAA